MHRSSTTSSATCARASTRAAPSRPKTAAPTTRRSNERHGRAGVGLSLAIDLFEAFDGFDVLLDELLHHVAYRSHVVHHPDDLADGEAGHLPILRAVDARERVGHQHE